MIFFNGLNITRYNFSNRWNREVQANKYKGLGKSIKPYILESTLLRRINTILDLSSSNNFMLSQGELKQAVKNRVLDLTYSELAELNTLEDHEAYEIVVNKIPSKYLNLY